MVGVGKFRILSAIFLSLGGCLALRNPLKVAGCVIPTDLNEISRVALFQKCISRNNGLGNETVCYNGLGCFPMESPWVGILRPFPSPMSPERVNTTLHLYTRTAPGRHVVKLWPNISLSGSDFKPKREKTVFITHGFASNGDSGWLKDLKDAYLKKVDANVFIVDWGKGASLLNYLQVASNTRIVGAELTRFIKHLASLGQSPSSLHLIGHSLGAQISSYTAKGIATAAVGKPGRLTAMDPAQPGFEGEPKEVRLHRDDADYVEVIHTDAKPFIPLIGFGMMFPVGHNDFYINGGANQPGCISEVKANITNILDLAKYTVEVVSEWVACSHGRAYQVFIESLRESNCWFWSRKMNVIQKTANIATLGFASVIDPIVKKLSECERETCTLMGFDAPKFPARGYFNTQTSGKKPYCVKDDMIDSRLKDLFQLQPIKLITGILSKVKTGTMKVVRKIPHL